MKETMGQIIKKLRKEKNLTQEELAEQLGVTSQAVSKWENDSGMPDIAQVVPLAAVFNVSTDVLFGICEVNNEDEVKKIINSAYSKLTNPVTLESSKEWYDELQKGLIKHPTNTVLLSHCLEAGISLAYPENIIFDSENAESIYKECIRQANIIIKYGKSTTDVLRAHMIMVLLHSAYGNFEMAKSHASEFPCRADMTTHKMEAYTAHFQNNYGMENKHWQTDFLYHLEAIIDDIVKIGLSYSALGDYTNAENTFLYALTIIDDIFKGEDATPPLHYRECGDIYSLLAEVYLKENRNNDALSMLERMVDYDLNKLPRHLAKREIKSPLLRSVGYDIHWKYDNYRDVLLGKLKNPIFEALYQKERYRNLITQVESLQNC